jgi:hypothetical protein
MIINLRPGWMGVCLTFFLVTGLVGLQAQDPVPPDAEAEPGSEMVSELEDEGSIGSEEALPVVEEPVMAAEESEAVADAMGEAENAGAVEEEEPDSDLPAGGLVAEDEGFAEGLVDDIEEGRSGPTWVLRAGALYRGNMDVDIRGIAHGGMSAPVTGRNRYPSGIGGTGSYANRKYDNGFVYIDPGTAFPSTLVPGLTWYWGYQSPGQYDSGGQVLSFTKTGGERFSQKVIRNEAVSRDEDGEAPGFSLELSRELGMERADASVTFGFSGFWMDEVETSAMPYEEQFQRTVFKVVDSYDTSKGGPPPSAPYTGTYRGPGYLITNIPQSRREVPTSMETWTARSRVDMSVDSELYQFWAGPRLDWSPGEAERLQLGLQPYLSLSYVDVEVSRRESLTVVNGAGATESIQTWRESASEDDVLFGLGVRGSIEFEFLPSWLLGVTGGYDWVSDDVDVRTGAAQTSVDVSGYLVGLTLSKEF